MANFRIWTLEADLGFCIRTGGFIIMDVSGDCGFGQQWPIYYFGPKWPILNFGHK